MVSWKRTVYRDYPISSRAMLPAPLLLIPAANGVRQLIEEGGLCKFQDLKSGKANGTGLMKHVMGFIALAVVLQGCDVGSSFRETVTDNGLVVRITSSSTSFFGIVSQNTAMRYEPSNLAPEFQRDSLQIRFSGEITSDNSNPNGMGPQGWGRRIILTEVRLRSDAIR